MSSEPPHKFIQIMGKNNKYLIKKLTKTEENEKKRKGITGENIPPEWYDYNFQLRELKKRNQILLSELKTKISSYKQQDVVKKRLLEKELVTHEYVTKLLIENNLTCHYCKEEMYIAYERCRDMQQWTLDRIDNNIGHNKGNVVVSCLKCNLQRKTRDSTKFLETKQMVITREGIDN